MPFLAQASSYSGSVDRVFLASVAICTAFLLLVTFFMVYFSIRYSRKRNPESVDVCENTPLEIIWTVVPLVLFLVMFYFGWTDFRKMRNPPPDAIYNEVMNFLCADKQASPYVDAMSIQVVNNMASSLPSAITPGMDLTPLQKIGEQISAGRTH